MNLETNSWHCKFYSDFYGIDKNHITSNGCKYLRNLIIAIILNAISFPLWCPTLFVKNDEKDEKDNVFNKISYGLFIWLYLGVGILLLLGITSLFISYNKSDFLFTPVFFGKILWFYIMLGGFFLFIIFYIIPRIIEFLEDCNPPKIKMGFIITLWRNISDKICFKINWTNKLTDNKEEK